MTNTNKNSDINWPDLQEIFEEAQPDLFGISIATNIPIVPLTETANILTDAAKKLFKKEKKKE